MFSKKNLGKKKTEDAKQQANQPINNHAEVTNLLEIHADIRAEILKNFGVKNMAELRVNTNLYQIVNEYIEQKIAPQRKEIEYVINTSKYLKDRYEAVTEAVEEKYLPFIWHKNNDDFNKKLANTIITMMKGPGGLTLPERDLFTNYGKKITNKSFNDTVEKLRKCLLRSDFSDNDLSELKLAGSKLSNANLSNIVLNKADLTDSDLSFADMSHADITDANVKGADMTGANLTGVKITFQQLMSLKSLANAEIDFSVNKFTEKEMKNINAKLNPANEKVKEDKYSWKKMKK